MSFWSTITETPGQPKSSILFTEGVTFTVNAPANNVFGIITDFQNYKAWNTWSPSIEFPDKNVSVGSRGTFLAKALKGDYQLPIEILELSSTVERHTLAFRGLLIPSWVATVERVHTVIPVTDGKSCEVRSWESMGGWGSYLLKHAMSAPEQVRDANAKFLNDLKPYAEKLCASQSA